MFVLWAILAAAAANDSPERALANTHETRHQVAFQLIGPDEAVFTVTRELAARSPSDPIALERHFQLPNESVVTSFAIQTDGAWRKGRLTPSPRPPFERPARFRSAKRSGRAGRACRADGGGAIAARATSREATRRRRARPALPGRGAVGDAFTR